MYFAGDDVVSMVVEVTEGYILSRVRCGEGGMIVGEVERVKILNMLVEVAEVVSGLLYMLCLYI